jgi:hypothetical protein
MTAVNLGDPLLGHLFPGFVAFYLLLLNRR